jgi:hypothetical protein
LSDGGTYCPLSFAPSELFDSAATNVVSAARDDYNAIIEPTRTRRKQMTPEEKNGRTIVLMIVGGSLLLSAVITAAYVAVLGTQRLPIQALRVLLTAGLMWWLYRGSRIAKWTVVVLFGLAALAGIMSLMFDNRFAATAGIKLGALYISFASTLVTSANANAFLRYQQARRS